MALSDYPYSVNYLQIFQNNMHFFNKKQRENDGYSTAFDDVRILSGQYITHNTVLMDKTYDGKQKCIGL